MPSVQTYILGLKIINFVTSFTLLPVLIFIFGYKSKSCKKILFGIEGVIKIPLLVILTIDIFFFLSFPAYSSQWYFAASKKSSYYFVDSENVQISGTNVTFWVMSVNPENGKVRSTKKCTIDCAVDIIAVIEVIRHGFDGTSVESYKHDMEWYVIPPDSATESIERLLCADGEPRKDIGIYLMKLFSK